MSKQDGGPVGSGDGESMSKRVGNQERDVAVALLDEHWRAGRLDPGEHELRVTRARAAMTQADLDVLFTDLPRAGQAPVSTGAVVTSGTGGFLENKRDTIIALTPFAALVLFFTTGYNWLWFLMVPVMGILLYGPDGAKPKRQRGSRGA